jgi:hypothetical protein
MALAHVSQQVIMSQDLCIRIALSTVDLDGVLHVCPVGGLLVLYTRLQQ